MKRLGCLLLAVCMLALMSTCMLGCLAMAEEVESLDEQFAAIFKKYKTTGGVITVARDGKIVYQYDYGYACKADKELVTEDTYFRLASVTKMITGIHVMQLVEQGLLDLDTDISEYFGYTIRNPHYKKVPITLRMLMSHTSTINAGGGYANDPSGNVWKMLSLERSRTANYYKYKPGSKYIYSNFGAGLMGSLIEIATGENFNDSITHGLFDPMGVDAAYNVNLLEEPNKISYLYTAEGRLKASRSNYLKRAWDAGVDPEMHFRSTAGGMWIKGEDLCKLGIMLCQGGTINGATILEPATIAEMMASQKDKPGITVDSPYGLCINRIDSLLEERMIYGHQGMSEGVVAALYFEPESQFVYSFITNGADSRKNNYIAIINRKLFALAWEQFGDPDVK